MYPFPYSFYCGFVDIIEETKKTFGYRRRLLGERPAQCVLDERYKLYRRGAIVNA